MQLAAATFAIRSQGETSRQMSSAIRQLSSGRRVVSAADDPAALVRGSAIEARLSGTLRAKQNALEAANVLQFAESTLSSVSTDLERIRTLSVQAASSWSGTGPRDAVGNEVTAILASLTSTLRTARSGDRLLFNGTPGTAQAYVPAVPAVSDIQEVLEVFPVPASSGSLTASAPFDPVDNTGGTLSALDLTVDGVPYSLSLAQASWTTVTQARDAIVTAIGALANPNLVVGTDVTVAVDGSNRLVITSGSTGSTSTVTSGASALATALHLSGGAAVDGGAAVAGVPYQPFVAGSPYVPAIPAARETPVQLTFQIGTDSGSTKTVAIALLDMNTLGLDNFNPAAADAIAVVDAALSKVVTMRSSLGSDISTLGYSGSVNDTEAASLRATHDALIGVDYAEAVTSFALMQTRLRAAVAMMSRAFDMQRQLAEILSHTLPTYDLAPSSLLAGRGNNLNVRL